MFKNYLKTTVRNIRRRKAYSFINIVGLAVALVCSFLILLHVQEELSYERGFSKVDHIYRITSISKSGNTYRHWAPGPPPLGPMIQEQIPEIEQAARFRTIKPVVLSYTPDRGTVRRFREDGGFFADPAAIDLFDLKFIKGDPGTALNAANSLILTARLAEKYFGTDDPIGKTLVEENSNRPYRVTGVIENMPSNTHLQFDYLASMSTWYQIMNNHSLLNSRTWKALYIYVLLDAQNEKELVESKLADFIQRSFQSRFEQTFHLQPIKVIHLRSKLEKEIGPNSDIAYIYIFSFTAVLILVIAGVNFVNLTTAQALKRMKEVGIRKVLGAQKRQLVKQFLGESLILTLFAGVVALSLLDLLLPFYNSISGKSFTFSQFTSVDNLLLLFFIVISTGLTAGLYPAFFISTLQPVNTLKGLKSPRSSVTPVRKGLVIFQFAISIFMIFSTITVYRQLVFFREKDLGFNKEKLIAVQLYGGNTVNSMGTVKTELLNHSAISHLSLVSNLPGERFSSEHLIPEGGANVEDVPLVRIIHVDEDFLETLGIELKEGQDFQKRSSEQGQFLLSETAVQTLGLQDPIGKRANNYGKKGEIVGVFRDFHFASLHNVIEPLVLDYRPAETKYLLVKFQGSNISEVLKTIEQKLHEVSPNHLFIYTFVDDNLNRLYAFEDKVGDIFKLFSLVAIFISCLGLFGLSVFSAELKVKEIGVRKVLGASVLGITVLFSKDFLRWVVFANIIAWPIAWYAIHKWLQNFAYRIDIGWWMFVLAGGLALVIALLTVSTQAIRAALANPVESLRYE